DSESAAACCDAESPHASRATAARLALAILRWRMEIPVSGSCGDGERSGRSPAACAACVIVQGSVMAVPRLCGMDHPPARLPARPTERGSVHQTREPAPRAPASSAAECRSRAWIVVRHLAYRDLRHILDGIPP